MPKRTASSRRPGKPEKRPTAIASSESEFPWPSPREIVDPRAPFLVPLLLLLASRVVLALAIPVAAEDAYITFRFARNFANGFGLVYNPGERVFGFSSPLWTSWMALGLKLGVAAIPWARVTTIALDVVTLFVVVSMLRRQISNRSAWCFAFFWAAWPYFAGVSVSGMENAVMIALIAVAAGSCAAKSPWSGPAIAGVALIRPEGLVSAAVLALFARTRDRWIAAGLVGAALVALALYFGTPVPQSLIAKSQVYGASGPWRGRFWWDWLFPFVIGRFPFVSDTGHLFLLAPLMGPAVWFGARALWAERRKPVAAFVAACVVVWLGYTLLGVAYFWWYLAVPLVGLAALAAIGFPLIVRGPAIYAGVALLVLGLWTVLPKLYIGRSQTELLAFGGVAKYLAEYAKPGQKVLLEPIGMVGFGAPVYVVDEIGLVSPEVARRRTQGAGWYADVLRRENPDWLVVRRSFLTGGRAFAGAGAPFRDVGERTASLSAYYLTASVDSSAKENTLMVLARRP